MGLRSQLDPVAKRIAAYRAFTHGYEVIDLIDAILTNTMPPELSIELLKRRMIGEERDGFGCKFD